MKAPALAAVMERRILVNYRVDPDLLGSYLPAPFRTALVGGHAVAGICLIRLGHIRPAGLRIEVDGVELETANWTLQPLSLNKVASSFFDDRRRFPAGTAVPDSAFLMSGLSTVWHPQPRLRAAAAS
jgi:hypothetical protein